MELFRAGGGHVHINLETSYSTDFSLKELPQTSAIKQITQESHFPQLPLNNKIGILSGSHNAMSNDLTKAIDKFYAKYDAVVFCDHTSGYYGAYRVAHTISSTQTQGNANILFPDLVIYLGK